MSRVQGCQATPRFALPVDMKWSRGGVHEEKPGTIALSFSAAGIIAKDTIGAFIPAYHIDPFIEDPGRVDEAIQNGLDSGVQDLCPTVQFIQRLNCSLCQEK